MAPPPAKKKNLTISETGIQVDVADAVWGVEAGAGGD